MRGQESQSGRLLCVPGDVERPRSTVHHGPVTVAHAQIGGTCVQRCSDNEAWGRRPFDLRQPSLHIGGTSHGIEGVLEHHEPTVTLEHHEPTVTLSTRLYRDPIVGGYCRVDASSCWTSASATS